MNLAASKRYALIIFPEFREGLEESVVSGVNTLEAAPQTFALCPPAWSSGSQSFLSERLLTYYLSSTAQLSFYFVLFLGISSLLPSGIVCYTDVHRSGVM